MRRSRVCVPSRGVWRGLRGFGFFCLGCRDLGFRGLGFRASGLGV